MATMDIFKGDAFTLVEMSDALNKVPYKPSFLGSLGIFEPKPIRTETVAIEKKENTLALVEASKRGDPLKQQAGIKRDIRDFRTVRLAKGDTLQASEIAGVRAFGSESEMQSMQSEVMERMIRLRDDIELTHENHRLGAIQGTVLDADGATVIRNWFTEWAISQAAEIDFDLDNAAPAEGAVKKLCNGVVRAMARAGKGAFGPGTEIIGLCGDNFYDDLTTHKEIRDTYKNQVAATELRGPYADVFDSFRYGGITWINYRGTDDGTTVTIPTDKVKFFPKGARGVFKHVMSPGESFDIVNTPGKPFYAITVPDRDRNMHVDLEVYSYPLYVCTRPEMLLRGKRT